MENLDEALIEEINAIDTRTKLLDRIRKIISNGGRINFEKVCDSTMDYNLRMIDSLMLKYLANTLFQVILKNYYHYF